MTDRALCAYVDALAVGRRPRRFQATTDDAELLRTAIALRASRPGESTPDDQFVSDLYQRLVEQADDAGPTAAVRPLVARRVRTAVAAVAASVSLIGGTYIATESVSSSPGTTAAVSVPRGNELRAGTFETPQGQVVGQIVAYRGRPSWVYMDVGVAQSQGTIRCKLQLDNGSIVAAGHMALHHGRGELSKSIQVDIHRLRGAQLFTSTGAVLASATFA
jgi:hypothetical protein